jgi:hypothetical protein
MRIALIPSVLRRSCGMDAAAARSLHSLGICWARLDLRCRSAECSELGGSIPADCGEVLHYPAVVAIDLSSSHSLLPRAESTSTLQLVTGLRPARETQEYPPVPFSDSSLWAEPDSLHASADLRPHRARPSLQPPSITSPRIVNVPIAQLDACRTGAQLPQIVGNRVCL